MGCCVSRSSASDIDDMENTITIGKNRPLIQERIRWKSDVPMTEGQLRSKRDEFWETAPAFEGRKEIWDALRAASALAEQGDYALSQAILDGANISLPDGTLRESYDELGNRYQIPYYCLSAPTNLVEERSSESSGGTLNGDGRHAAGSTDRAGSSHIGTAGTALGELLTLKLRLSTTGEDLSVDCHSRETVHIVKQRLHQTRENIPAANQQRWLFGGRILLDKTRIGDCKIPQNFIVQVVLHSNSGKEKEGDQDRPTGNGSAAVTPHKEALEVHSRKRSPDEGSTTDGKPQARNLPVASLSKDQTFVSELPGSAVHQLSSGVCTKNGNDGGPRHAGSSSSRRSTGKQHSRQHGGKSRARQSLSSAANGSASSTIAQQRCNSLSSKRSAESPTPVETA